MVDVRQGARSTGALVLVALLAALVPGVAARAQDADPRIVRVDGEDRYATAAAIADEVAPGVDRVLLATGVDFPDALAAGPIAGSRGWPILLVEPDRLPQATADALDRLDPGAITVLGGPAAVEDTVLQAARTHTSGPVNWLEGADRYATAARVVDEYVDAGVSVAYVATGLGFADALAGGPAAVVTGGPLLLVEQDDVPAATMRTLQRLRPGRIVVLGGPTAVSQDVRDRLASLTDGPVQRVAGPDRYATAAAIAAEAFPDPVSTAYLATGETFPDALAGGPAAGRDGAPLLTVRHDCVPDVVADALERLDPDTVVVLGGPAAVSRTAADLARCSDVGQPRPTTIQTGLAAPWDVVFTPDGRTFLTERDAGRVRERLADGSLRTVREFDVDDDGEGGLLGLAASPDYATDGWLYALYTRTSDQVIVRFRPDGQGAQTIVAGLPDNTYHDAGRIEFGPDGMLYVGMGDAGDPDAAQDLGQRNGKILRYTPTGAPAPGNPFGDDNPVYAYGFRDPQGLTWDGAGRMYASEFGQNRQDEIDRVVAGGNYGWPIYEGNLEYQGGQRPDDYVAPIFTAHPDQASWSGASVLVGGDIPQWEGDLFVAALRGERLYHLDLDDSGNVAGSEQLLVGQYGRLRHVTPAPDGSLWVLTSNCDGRGSCPTGTDDRIVRLGP